VALLLRGGLQGRTNRLKHQITVDRGLELSEKAQSTLEEQLAEERRLREEAEQEREDFRQQLAVLRRAREVAETVEGALGEAEPRASATGGAQEGARRPWWRRVFRG
jgi:hypothetical protein